MKMIEFPFCRAQCHHIDLDAINASLDERIKGAKGGGGGEPSVKVLKKYQEELIENAKRHNILHLKQDELKEVETGMVELRQNYKKQGFIHGEICDERWQRLQKRKSRLAEDGFYMLYGNRTRLSTDWDILKSFENPLLTESGDDSQHIADWNSLDGL